ncbi:MAG: class I SAM-dependent methyltransferase [Clostridium sp.]|uniref:class I SAM-dependent methyltransferase n=1 Tax=Clostridium sp. TaxID=1506 RepID=UPI0030443BD3
MQILQNTEILKNQYKNADNLNKRISIHDKYSTNKLGFGNWIFSKYDILPNSLILELGCGTGDMWIDNLDKIKNGSNLILTDFSEGMLESAQKNLSADENIIFKLVDIQNIPFADECFDIVIANMMLYHVPDLNRGLLEVMRVLKPSGKFYCATFGENGIVEYIEDALKEFNIARTQNNTFTLQKGTRNLSKYFKNVERLNYEDSLEVTDTSDMVDYIYSLGNMTNIKNVEYETIKKVLESKKENGILNIPKEYGLFVCTK